MKQTIEAPERPLPPPAGGRRTARSRQRRPILMALGAVAILAAVLFFTLGRRGPSAAGLTQYKVARAEAGTVRKTVSSTGTLQPWTVVDIKSKAGGRVLEMLVDAGTPVTKGQIIARIDPSDTLLNVNQAQADIAAAQARKEQSARTHALQIQQSSIAIANAQAQLNAALSSRAAARSRLTTARRQAANQPRLTSASIAQAQAGYNQAVKQRAQLNSTNRQQRASTKSAYDQAVANAKNAQSDLTRQKNLLARGFVSQQAVDNAQANYDVAQAQLETTRTNLQTLDAQLQANVEEANARVAQAQASLNSARAGSVEIQTRQDAVREAEAGLRQADAQVTQAQQNLREARANTANNAIRELDITSAQATETRSRAALKNANETLSQTTVRAPSEGVILQKYVDEGTIITSGLSLNSTGSSIVQLGDTTRMYVDVTVDEADIANVDEGQKVEISMDAYPGVPFEGKVSRVDPRAVVEQNVTMIHVRVEVDNSSPTFRLLKPGMNATCEFVVDEREDVVTVPSGAVQTEDDASYVQIASGGKPAPAEPGATPDPETLVSVQITRRPVEVGLAGNEATEIIEGLKEGEMIVVQTIEPAPASAARGGGSPFAGGPGGGGGRGR